MHIAAINFVRTMYSHDTLLWHCQYGIAMEILWKLENEHENIWFNVWNDYFTLSYWFYSHLCDIFWRMKIDPILVWNHQFGKIWSFCPRLYPHGRTCHFQVAWTIILFEGLLPVAVVSFFLFLDLLFKVQILFIICWYFLLHMLVTYLREIDWSEMVQATVFQALKARKLAINLPIR